MKKILILFIICFFTYKGAFAFSLFSLKYENLYPINDKNGGGYINKNGEIILKQKYKFAGKFNKNYAIVQGKNSKYGIIDKKGNIIIDFEYDYLDNLSEDFVIYKEDGKYGFINILKNQKSKPIYDNMKKFQEGLAAVYINGKWGFINKKGEIIIKPQYYNVGNYSGGLASISNSKYSTSGYINKKGNVVIKFKDNNLDVKEFREGLAPILKGEDKACSYINKKGRIIIDKEKIYPINLYCGNFYEGLNVFYIDKNPREIITGYINKKGKIKYSMLFSIPETISEGEFSAFDEFNSNMAQITVDYKTGYINRDFKLIIPAIYEFARDFDNDLAYVKFENKEGYINKKGEWIWFKVREGM